VKARKTPSYQRKIPVDIKKPKRAEWSIEKGESIQTVTANVKKTEKTVEGGGVVNRGVPGLKKMRGNR